MSRVRLSVPRGALFHSLAVGTLLIACTAAQAATVEKPVFSPSSGELKAGSKVTVTCPTRDVVIRMVSGGSEPGASSPIVSGAAEISSVHAKDGKVVLKARAYLKDGKGQSDVATATYTFKADPVALPVFSPPSGSLKEGDKVSVTCATRDVTIRMESRGAEPTTSSPAVSGAVKIEGVHVKDGKVTLKARAYRNDRTGSSDVATAVFSWASVTVAKPVFSIRSDTVVKSGTRVELECETKDVTIHYVFGGNEPGSLSLKADGPLEISEKVARDGKVVLKARAIRKDGRGQSEVATATYLLEAEPVRRPEFSIPSGTLVKRGAPIDVYCATKDVTIRVAFGGSEPTPSSSAVSGRLEISERHFKDGKLVLKARAYRNDGRSQSEVVTAEYFLEQERVATPVFSPPSGSVLRPGDRISVTCATADARVVAEYHGRIPTKSSPAFDRVFTVPPDAFRSGEFVIKVIAFARSGPGESPVVTATYRSAQETLPPPTISPSAGTYADNVRVEIRTSAAGATIRYTTDGREPTAASKAYDGAFQVTPTREGVTVLAKAFKAGATESRTAAATYRAVASGPVQVARFSPASGTRFTGKLTVKVETGEPGGTIVVTPEGGGLPPGDLERAGSGSIEITESAAFRARVRAKDGRVGEAIVARYVRVPAPPKLTPASDTRFRGSIRIEIAPANPTDIVEWELDGGAFARDKRRTSEVSRFELYESATITAKSWSREGESSNTVRIRVEKD